MDTPTWRYATPPVLTKMYRKLLFNNLSILRKISIILIAFCQEGPQIHCAKFGANQLYCWGGVQKSRFATFRECANKSGGGNERGTIQGTCGHVDSGNKLCECALKYMGVISQKILSMIIAPPSFTKPNMFAE